MSCSSDIQVLEESCREINEHSFIVLSDSKLRCLGTARGRRIFDTLRRISIELLQSEHRASETEERLNRTIDGLRDDVQRLTDALMESERKQLESKCNT